MICVLKWLCGSVPILAVYFEVREKNKMVSGIEKCYKAGIVKC